MLEKLLFNPEFWEEEEGEGKKDAPPSSTQDITTKEAGRMGGKKILEKYGKEHFAKLGQRGGRKTSERHTHEFYESMGRRGGLETARRYGRGHMRKIATE